jgi:hypothetical protein
MPEQEDLTRANTIRVHKPVGIPTKNASISRRKVCTEPEQAPGLPLMAQNLFKFMPAAQPSYQALLPLKITCQFDQLMHLSTINP